MNEPDQAGPPERLTVRIPTAMKMLGLGRSKLYDLMDNREFEKDKVRKARLEKVQSLHDYCAL